MPEWIAACPADEVDPEDVIPFEHGGRDYAIYRSPEDAYFATTGTAPTRRRCCATGWWRTASSSVPSTTAGSTTPAARRSAPRCGRPATYPVKVEGGTVYVDLA